MSTPVEVLCKVKIHVASFFSTLCSRQFRHLEVFDNFLIYFFSGFSRRIRHVFKLLQRPKVRRGAGLHVSSPALQVNEDNFYPVVNWSLQVKFSLPGYCSAPWTTNTTTHSTGRCWNRRLLWAVPGLMRVGPPPSLPRRLAVVRWLMSGTSGALLFDKNLEKVKSQDKNCKRDETLPI